MPEYARFCDVALFATVDGRAAVTGPVLHDADAREVCRRPPRELLDWPLAWLVPEAAELVGLSGRTPVWTVAVDGVAAGLVSRETNDRVHHGRSRIRHASEGPAHQPRPALVRDDRRDRGRPGGRSLVLPRGWRCGHCREVGLRF